MLQLSLVWRTPLSSHGLDFRCVSDRPLLESSESRTAPETQCITYSFAIPYPASAQAADTAHLPAKSRNPREGPPFAFFYLMMPLKGIVSHTKAVQTATLVLRPERKFGAWKTTLLEEDQVREQWNKLDIITHPWDLMECNHGCWGNCQCHWKASWDYCWKIVVIKGGSSGLRESKFIPIFKKTWDRGYREVQADQLHLDPWVSDAANCSGSHF